MSANQSVVRENVTTGKKKVERFLTQTSSRYKLSNNAILLPSVIGLRSVGRLACRKSRKPFSKVGAIFVSRVLLDALKVGEKL